MEILFVLLILVTHAVSDSCVIHTFEEDYPDFFNNESGICVSAMPMWILGSYKDLALIDHNMYSTKFISPLAQDSCASSIIFPMQQGGTLEVNIFMETTSSIDLIDVLVMSRDSTGFANHVGSASNSAFLPGSFVSGWHTLSITVEGSGEFHGYITLLGWESPASTVLVDSLRYIPPGMDASECEIYPEATISTDSTTGTESTTEIVTESATTEIVAESATTEIVTEVPTVTSTHSISTTELPTSVSDSENGAYSTITFVILGFLFVGAICYYCCESDTIKVKVKHVYK